MVLTGVAAALCTPFSATAQTTYEVVAIEKMANYLQTDATTTQPALDAYALAAFVEGSNLSGISAPTLTPPAGSGVSGATLVYDAWDDMWDHEVVFSGKAQLDAAYSNGTYAMNVAGTALTLNLTGDAYPNTPLLSFNQGFWSGGVFYFDPTQNLVMTTNVFSSYGSHPEAFISINVDGDTGPGYFQQVEQFHSDAPDDDFLSLTLAAFDVASGQDLEVEAGFTAVVDFTSDATFPDAPIAALYSSFVNLQLRAVPEAANAAWVAGLGALGFVLSRRRRRT